jgi:hypothetical protein
LDTVEILEGDVYEGCISALGGTGPLTRWIIVSPHGKRHAHSITDPLELHCMPFGILLQAIDRGELAFVESQPDHPAIRLQRVKEEGRLQDTHLGLRGEVLEGMIALLEKALEEEADYAPYLAGEILALIDRSHYDEAEINQIVDRVHQRLRRD